MALVETHFELHEDEPWMNASNTNVSTPHETVILYDVPVGIVILLSLFYGGISLIAVIGNLLVIWIVATTRQMHTVTNLFIANLASADVIIGMFAIPFQFQAALLQRWNLPDFMCPFCPFVQYLSVNVSVFTLTAIAVDRHRAIINPLRARPTKSTTKIVIGIIWLLALAFATPIAIALRVRKVRDEIHLNGDTSTNWRPFCDVVNLSHEQMRTYRYYLVFVQYVIPFCVISFVYIQMAVRLWGSKTPGNAQDARDVNMLRNKKKVIKMLIIVVILFGVCWLPLQSYNALQVTWPNINKYHYINIIFFCCDWLAMSNSCYNPFIYGIYNEKFKREFWKRFPFCRCGCDPTECPTGDKTISMYTRASSLRSNYTNSSTRNKIIHNLEPSRNLYANNTIVGATWRQSATAAQCNNKDKCVCYPKVMYQHVDGSKQTTTTTSALIYQPANGKGKCCCQNRERHSIDAGLCGVRLENNTMCNNTSYLNQLRRNEAETEFLEEESDPASHQYVLSDFDL